MVSVRSSADLFGDFQTPVELAESGWRAINISGVDVLVEPTVGIGAFLATAPKAIEHLPWMAYDIDARYVEMSREVAAKRSLDASIDCKDAFNLSELDLADRVAGKTVLAVGNPPWVTNSAQGGSLVSNLPTKVNRFGLRGLDAMTGKANFDIAEAILLAVMAALSSAEEVRLAFLVKRSVAIKMVKDLLGTPGVIEASFAKIEALKWFGASVEAGLFQLAFKRDMLATTDRLMLADGLGKPFAVEAGIVDGVFVGDLRRYSRARVVEADEGHRLAWRQGLKHDLTKVLELRRSGDGFENGLGEAVEIEADLLCPFFKSSDVASGRPPRRWFPLYQHDLSGPLEDLAVRWSKLATYLATHRDRFAARGSSIYKGKPDFMLFGVGSYTLAPYKVAISGFYKKPHFALLEPDESGRPPLVDDTCYMLPFEDRSEAEAMTSYLNSELVQDFLHSVADTTAKRPYTKDILGRIAPPTPTLDSSPAPFEEPSTAALASH